MNQKYRHRLTVDVRLCGALEVVVDARVIDLRKTARQGRLTLAYMALRAGRPVTRAELMEHVWVDPDPQRVSPALSQTLSRLRAVLGRDVLQRLPNGGQCLRGDIRVDVTQAEEYLRAARTDFTRGDAAGVRTAAEAVLERLHGEVLLGDTAAWLEPVRQRTIDMRAEALALLGAAALRANDHARAEEAAREALVHADTDELAWGVLIEAQAVHSGVARASETFHEMRRLLRDRYGLVPSARLVALHERLLDPGRESEPSPAAPPRRPELPARINQASQTSFVGREGEWRALHAAWDDTCRSGTRIAFLAGEPGIGKTRLGAQFGTWVHEHGGTVLYGRCEEDVGAPYQPWIDVLHQCLAATPPGAAERHVRAHGEALARLAPALGHGDGSAPLVTDPESERFLVFAAIRDIFTEVASSQPALLLLDDLHWADRSTLLLLRHIATSLVECPILILAAYRTSDVSNELATVLADLQEVGGPRITLEGFSVQDVIALMALIAGGREITNAERELAAGLVGDTNGNPFFVVQILRNLMESGTIMRDGLGWRLTATPMTEVPESVLVVIGRRVRRLGDRAVMLLQTAAVIGQEFELGVLATVAETSEDIALDVLEAAERARLVSEIGNGRFAFTHALVKHALGQQLSRTRRARLHGRIAVTFEAMGEAASAGETAHHWIAAKTDRPRMLRAIHRAGRQALDRLGPDEAARWFRTGLDLLEAQEELDRCDLMIGLGEAQRLAGDGEYRRTLLDAASLARRRNDAGALARAALANSRGFESASGNVDADRVATLEAALATDETSHGSRARLLAQLQLELTFVESLEERRRLSDEALGLAAGDADLATLAHVLWARHAVLWTPDLLAEHIANADRLEEVARQRGDLTTTFWAACDRALTSVWSADLAGVDEGLATMQRVADRVEQPILRWIQLWYGSWRAYLAGNLDTAAALARSAAEIGVASGQPDAEAFQMDQMLPILWDRGELAGMVPLLEQLVTNHPGLPVFGAWLSVALAEVGRVDEAQVTLRTAAKSGFTDVPFNILWLSTLCLYAEAATVTHASPEAALLYELLTPYPDQIVFNASSILGSVSRFLGGLAATLADWPAADTHYARAIELDERMQSPTLAARTRIGWAAALAAGGGPGAEDRIAAHVEQASRIAGELRMTGLQWRFETLEGGALHR
jgi:DNA-binding SARP family transcriptional activator